VCSACCTCVFFLVFILFSWCDQVAGTRRWLLWWANTRGGVDAIRAVHCCVCVQFSKSRFPLTHADGFKPHKSPYSAATYIFVDPVLPMSEFVLFGPEGQSDWRHSIGVHGGADRHLVSSSRHLRCKTSVL